MAGVDKDGIGLDGQDLVGEIPQGVGIHRRHGRGDDLDLALRELPAQALLQHAREGRAIAVREARRTRAALHHQPQRAVGLLRAEETRFDADPGRLLRIGEQPSDHLRVGQAPFRLRRMLNEQRLKLGRPGGPECQFRTAQEKDRDEQGRRREQYPAAHTPLGLLLRVVGHGEKARPGASRRAVHGLQA
ncbi:MAG: hypothetical protein P8080_08730 [Gammaproteobacteria bacterium]